MKTIAFAKDPDGYWIELCNRSKNAEIKEKFNLSQTMIRVKDPQKSLAFYRDLLGMKLVMKKIHDSFTVYFLTHLEPGAQPPENIEVRFDIYIYICASNIYIYIIYMYKYISI